ncbi:MAG TPA: UpxY family transcription antiterminator [Niabella sp.]
MSAFKTGWYVIYTKNRHERKVAEQLERVGVEYFLPCINAVRQWYDRKKIISVPLFPSYIFVKIKEVRNYLASVDLDGVLYFLKTGKEMAPVKEELLNSIRLIVNHCREVEVSSELFDPGKRMVISDGPFTGLQCEVVEHMGNEKILVKVAILNRNILVKHTVDQLLPAEVCRC